MDIEEWRLSLLAGWRTDFSQLFASRPPPFKPDPLCIIRKTNSGIEPVTRAAFRASVAAVPPKVKYEH